MLKLVGQNVKLGKNFASKTTISRSNGLRRHKFASLKYNSRAFSTVPPTSVGTEDVEALETLPTIAEADLSFGPVNFFVKSIIELHDMTGLPWWITIATFAAGFRVLCTPFVIKTKQNGARLGYAKADMEAAQKHIISIRENSNATQEDKLKAATKLTDVFKKHKCNPFSSILLILAQLPLYSSCFFAVRRLCTQYEDLKLGGPLEYFPDLSVPDPSHTLGPLTSIVLVVSMRLGVNDAQMANPDPDERTQRMHEMMKYLGYGFGLTILPASMFMPSGVMLYILSTSTAAFGVNLLLRAPPVSKAFGMHPDTLPGKLADESINANLTPSKPLVSSKPPKSK